jgi:hypothetical protein
LPLLAWLPVLLLLPRVSPLQLLPVPRPLLAWLPLLLLQAPQLLPPVLLQALPVPRQ